jgi:hypothetical protein
MALIPIRIDRTTKPPIGTPLRSDGHWSVKGIVQAWVFGQGEKNTITDLVNSRRANLTGTADNTPDGLYFPSNTNYYQVDGSSPPFGKVGTGDFSLITEVKSTSTSTQGAIFDFAGFNTGILIRRPSSSTILHLYVASTETNIGASGTLPTGVNVALSIVRRGGIVTLLKDGIFNSSNSLTGNVTATGLTRVGCSSHNSAEGWVGSIKYIYLYARAITNEESISLKENPWQIYEPETVWVNITTGQVINCAWFGI